MPIYMAGLAVFISPICPPTSSTHVYEDAYMYPSTYLSAHLTHPLSIQPFIHLQIHFHPSSSLLIHFHLF